MGFEKLHSKLTGCMHVCMCVEARSVQRKRVWSCVCMCVGVPGESVEKMGVHREEGRSRGSGEGACVCLKGVNSEKALRESVLRKCMRVGSGRGRGRSGLVCATACVKEICIKKLCVRVLRWGNTLRKGIAGGEAWCVVAHVSMKASVCGSWVFLCGWVILCLRNNERFGER